MNVTVCGAGAVGSTLAAVLSTDPATSVRVLSGSRSARRRQFEILVGRDILLGYVNLISHDPAEAVKDADIVFLAVPSHVRSDILSSILPYLPRHACLLSLPGNGGLDRQIRAVTQHSFLGSRRTPFTVRSSFDFDAAVTGVANCIELAGSGDTQNIVPWLESSLNIPVRLVSSFESITLCPANAVMHSARLVSVMMNGAALSRPLGMYSEWDDCASEIALRMDEDIKTVTKALRINDLPTLKEHYGVVTAAQLTKRLRGLASLSGAMIPMRKSGDHYVLDVENRIVKEEALCGLPAMLETARCAGTPVPTLQAITEALRGLCSVPV
ncbi:MAG TPA: NAD/NADP octopine/nopaline dehydrogenase family protein [Candidatus Rubrimentiphilum sp.]|nr:NAD/NADP octopine/nopaline dehydrogenase family protein [Candidatus Rubrimentiphilum sp.]